MKKIDIINAIAHLSGQVGYLVDNPASITNARAEFDAIKRELDGIVADLTGDGVSVKLTVDTSASFAPEIQTGKISKGKGKRRRIRLVSPSAEQIAALTRVECEEGEW